MTRPLSHALRAALLAPTMPARLVRPALVVRCGARALTKTTLPITYTPDDTERAWYAELRAKQAVR